jgi:oligopeptide transport system permease protein
MATQDAVIAPLFIEHADGIARGHRGLWSDAWRRMLQNKLAMIGLVVLFVIVAVSLLATQASVVERHAPYAITTAKQLGPTGDHFFGTDQLGRDTWARTLEGVRISLQIGLGTQVVVLTLGLFFGVLAAFGGKFTDNLVMRFTDIMFSFPDLLFIILVREILIGQDIDILSGPVVMMLAIGMIAWTTIARLVRGQMLSLGERDFVTAARALGATRWRIVTTHMLPNTLGPVIVAVTFGIPTAIFAEAALSFLGLGIPAPSASLGTLVADGNRFLQVNRWNVIFPASAIAVLMLSFTFIGDGLRDALDPRTR